MIPTGIHQVTCSKASDHSKPCDCVLAPNYKADSAVDHPSHYGGKDNPYEAIKVIEAWGLDFSLGNAVKYISRAGKKDPTKLVEDLQKASFYLNRAIEKCEEEAVAMKIASIEVETSAGASVVRPRAPIDVDPVGDMPAQFRALTEALWERICRYAYSREGCVKILVIEIDTDLGRRVVQLGAGLSVTPTGAMPAQFRSLTEVLWGLVREVAAQAPSPTAPKAEA